LINDQCPKVISTKRDKPMNCESPFDQYLHIKK